MAILPKTLITAKSKNNPYPLSHLVAGRPTIPKKAVEVLPRSAQNPSALLLSKVS